MVLRQIQTQNLLWKRIIYYQLISDNYLIHSVQCPPTTVEKLTGNYGEEITYTSELYSVCVSTRSTELDLIAHCKLLCKPSDKPHTHFMKDLIKPRGLHLV